MEGILLAMGAVLLLCAGVLGAMAYQAGRTARETEEVRREIRAALEQTREDNEAWEDFMREEQRQFQEIANYGNTAAKSDEEQDG